MIVILTSILTSTKTSSLKTELMAWLFSSGKCGMIKGLVPPDSQRMVGNGCLSFFPSHYRKYHEENSKQNLQLFTVLLCACISLPWISAQSISSLVTHKAFLNAFGGVHLFELQVSQDKCRLFHVFCIASNIMSIVNKKLANFCSHTTKIPTETRGSFT